MIRPSPRPGSCHSRRRCQYLPIGRESHKTSNILNAEFLTGHSRCTFADAGNFGIGHSDPEEIRGKSVQEILQESEAEEPLPFTRHVKDAAEFVEQILDGDDDAKATLSLARQALLGGEVSEFYPRTEGTWFDAIITIVAFNAAFGVRVCAIG
jgi:hypothetical protein